MLFFEFRLQRLSVKLCVNDNTNLGRIDNPRKGVSDAKKRGRVATEEKETQRL